MDILKNDGWRNIFTGLGNKAKDKLTATFARWEKPIEADLEEIFAADDIAQTLVNDLPNEGTREWIEFKSKNTDAINLFTELSEQLKLRSVFNKAWSWSRLYGGSGIWIITDADDMQVQEPLDIANINSEGGVKRFVVFSRWELNAHDIDGDPSSENYGLPTRYRISSRTGSSDANNLTVHHSRILRFDGIDLPRRVFQQNNYWGDSVLTATLDAIKGYNTAHAASVRALDDFSVPVMKMKSLAELMMNGKEQTVLNRIASINMCRSVMRMMIIDDEESFDYVNRSLAQVGEIVSKAEDRLAVASKMPKTRILGQQSKGMDNGGEADERKWYDYVASQQEKILTTHINKAVQAINNSRNFVTTPVQDISWDFTPLWQMSEQEKSTLYKSTADADALYLDRGVLSPMDVQKRFLGDKFNTELKIEEEELEIGQEINETPIELEQQAAQAGLEVDPSVAGRLNGAQIQSLIEILKEVSAKEIPIETAKTTIEVGLGLEKSIVEKLVGPVENFIPASQEKEE